MSLVSRQRGRRGELKGSGHRHTRSLSPDDAGRLTNRNLATGTWWIPPEMGQPQTLSLATPVWAGVAWQICGWCVRDCADDIFANGVCRDEVNRSIGRSLQTWPAEEEQYAISAFVASLQLLTFYFSRQSLPASSARWTSGRKMRSVRISSSKMSWPSASQPEASRPHERHIPIRLRGWQQN
jgi:hypothetical protein